MREEYRGKGIAAAAVKLMTDYLRIKTDVEISTAGTMPENKASAHVPGKERGTLITWNNEGWGYELPKRALR